MHWAVKGDTGAKIYLINGGLWLNLRGQNRYIAAHDSFILTGPSSDTRRLAIMPSIR
jgi:hypothetical protein